MCGRVGKCVNRRATQTIEILYAPVRMCDRIDDRNIMPQCACATQHQRYIQ